MRSPLLLLVPVLGYLAWRAVEASPSSRPANGSPAPSSPAGPPSTAPPPPAQVPAELPATAGPEREAYLLERLLRGAFMPPSWVEIESVGAGQAAGYRLLVDVFADGLRMSLGAGEPVRITPNFETWQRAADKNGWQLLTPHLERLRWAQAQTRLPARKVARPRWVADGTMSHTARMIEQSVRLDQLLAQKGHPQGALVGGGGKIWALSSRLGRHAQCGLNFGLFNADGSVVQEPGCGHYYWGHTDYSQHAIAAAPTGVLITPSGEMRPALLRDLMADSQLHSLVTGDDAAHPYWRHPQIPQVAA